MDSVAFYEELMNQLSNHSQEGQTCLISGECLYDGFIKLECDHSFNYNYIYNEVIRQKTEFNTLEVQRLRTCQIKCPYCRNVQDSLLPPRTNFEMIHGVNKPLKYCMTINNCEAVLKGGKRKGQVCNKPCMEKYCNYHKNYKTTEDITTCSAILKSGKRKGETCKNKPKQDGLCLRHIKNKTN